MTKKDYELIAGEIALEYQKYIKYNELDQAQAIWILAMHLKNAFVQNNPKFNRSKFLKACGLEA